MNLTRIEYFLVAARYLNFTKAANVLYITQPSLSKQIALLEEELGVELFTRVKNTLNLTPAGEMIYLEFSRIIPEAEAILEKAKKMEAAPKGTLSLGCVESGVIGNAAMKILQNFVAENKENVSFFIERYPYEVLHRKLIDGSLDAVFTVAGDNANMKNFNYVEIEKRQTHIIISKDHRLASKSAIGLDDLKDETFVLVDREKSRFTYDKLFEACRNHGFFPKVRYAPNNETILDYLEIGQYVAFFDKSIIANRKDKLKWYPSPIVREFSFLCIWKKNNSNPVFEQFVQMLPSSPKAF